MTLFAKECKKVLLSIPYIILVLAVIFMAYSQGVFPKFANPQVKPEPNGSYGMTYDETPQAIMPAALGTLRHEHSLNNYTAYPIGFFKSVKLSDSQQLEIANIIATLEATTNYDDFKALLFKADDIIGGGSKYSEQYLLSNFGQTPITYDQAMANYNDIATLDRFTGAYARLFSDYIGITLSLLPVFVAVALCLKDRRAKMHELIAVRRATSFGVIFARFFAIIAMIMLPLIAISYIPSIAMWGDFSGAVLDYFAPLKYAFGWILPSIMMSTAVGMFLTVLTDTPIAIAVHGLWWFIDMNMGVRFIGGGHCPLGALTPRHNQLGGSALFFDNLPSLVENRLLFAGAAFLLVLATAIIFEIKRKGRLNIYEWVKAIFDNRKNKSQA